MRFVQGPLARGPCFCADLPRCDLLRPAANVQLYSSSRVLPYDPQTVLRPAKSL